MVAALLGPGGSQSQYGGSGTKLSLGDIEGIGAGEVGDGLGELRLACGAVLQLGGPRQNRGEGCKIRLLDSFILNVLGDILEDVSGLACLLDFQHDGDEGPRGDVR